MILQKLEPIQDAVGQEIYRYHQGDTWNYFEIVERDDGYIHISDALRLYFSTYDRWHPAYKEAIDLAKGRTLDIACGAGRHSLYLQSKGLDVLGIDVSPLAVETSRLRGVQNAEVLSYSEIGPEHGTFDTISMLGNGFGLFGTPENAQEQLRRFHSFTTADTLILAENVDPYLVWDEERWDYPPAQERTIYRGQVTTRIRYKKYTSPWFDFLFTSRDETAQIIAGTGWKISRMIDMDASWYVAVLAKDQS